MYVGCCCPRTSRTAPLAPFGTRGCVCFSRFVTHSPPLSSHPDSSHIRRAPSQIPAERIGRTLTRILTPPPLSPNRLLFQLANWHQSYGDKIEILLYPSDEFGAQELPSAQVPAFVAKQGLPTEGGGCTLMEKGIQEKQAKQRIDNAKK